jgi:hypothetical protein
MYFVALASTLETRAVYDGRSKMLAGGSITSAPSEEIINVYSETALRNVPMTIVGLFGSLREVAAVGSGITLMPPSLTFILM